MSVDGGKDSAAKSRVQLLTQSSRSEDALETERCGEIRKLLGKIDVDYSVVPDDWESHAAVVLTSASGNREVPQLFVSGKFVGGFEAITKMDPADLKEKVDTLLSQEDKAGKAEGGSDEVATPPSEVIQEEKAEKETEKEKETEEGGDKKGEQEEEKEKEGDKEEKEEEVKGEKKTEEDENEKEKKKKKDDEEVMKEESTTSTATKRSDDTKEVPISPTTAGSDDGPKTSGGSKRGSGSSVATAQRMDSQQSLGRGATFNFDIPGSDPHVKNFAWRDVKTFFPLEDLQNKKQRPEGVPPNWKEAFLSEEDFLSAFGLEKAKFYELPLWKRQQKKKEQMLF